MYIQQPISCVTKAMLSDTDIDWEITGIMKPKLISATGGNVRLCQNDLDMYRYVPNRASTTLVIKQYRAAIARHV